MISFEEQQLIALESTMARPERKERGRSRRICGSVTRWVASSKRECSQLGSCQGGGRPRESVGYPHKI